MRLSGAAAILFLVSVAAAGTEPTSEAGPVERRLRTIDPSVTGVWERFTREVHEEFVRRHPEIKVIAQESLTIS